MQSSIVSLSNELAALVEAFQADVVAVHARPHYPSSGVVWRPGVVVTADHTIRQEEDIQVTPAKGETVRGSLAGRDPGTDIAVLKVEGLTPSGAEAGPAEPVKIGELALVLGRSPDSGPNASLGVISAVSGPWRTWRGGRLDQYIRLDATLFPNSSGGAVVDCRGRRLGIATSGLSRIAGLSIPASSVDRVVDAVLTKGHVPRGYLGVAVQPVAIPQALRTRLSLTNKGGVMVVSAEPGGPAEKAGVLLGDVLVTLGSSPVSAIEDIQAFSESAAIGQPVTVGIIRAGELHQLSITVAERPGR